MTESRRSSRAKQAVNYTAFADDNDGDSDGDFTEPTPPTTKKPKDEKEKKAKKLAKKKKPANDPDEDYDEFRDTSRGKRKERKPIEDRMFDRELELALEMSKQESSQETEEPPRKKSKAVNVMVHSTSKAPELSTTVMSETSTIASDDTNVKASGADGNEDKENLPMPLASSSPLKTRTETAAPRTSSRHGGPCESSNTADFDVIETLDTSVEDVVDGGRRGRRKAAVAAVAKQRGMADRDDDAGDVAHGNKTKRRKKSDEDEDFDAGLDASDDDDPTCDDDDDDDDDYEGDEDFSASKSKKRKQTKSKKETKREAKKTESKASSRKPRTTGAKPSPKPGPASKSPGASLVRRAPVGRAGPPKGFTPPSQTTGTTPTLKTSGATSPRMGLASMKRPLTSPTAASGNNPLGGVKLVSPGPGIRLGLSKFARIKPLHSNAKV
ncbi:uncharacterized protein [Diadema antillarum]|uniref:uncharacterized protein n=1 Tax=Diadema antillarum TaxID=105358 RepID=UPI003A89F0EA